jgi:drug/metabolite transporter (DMT)-like permease
VLGLLNPLIYYVLLFAAYTRLPGHHALILNYTWPLFLAILAGPILGKRPGPRVAAGLIVSFAGVVIMYLQNRETAEADPFGMVLALGSAIVWAVAWLVTMNDSRPAVSKLFGAFCFGSVYAIAAFLATGAAESFSLTGVPNIVYVALAEMGLSFLLWLRGLEQSANPGATGNLAYASPFLSLLALRLVIREEISVFALLGLVLIVGGIVIGKTRSRVAG